MPTQKKKNSNWTIQEGSKPGSKKAVLHDRQYTQWTLSKVSGNLVIQVSDGGGRVSVTMPAAVLRAVLVGEDS